MPLPITLLHKIWKSAALRFRCVRGCVRNPQPVACPRVGIQPEKDHEDEERLHAALIECIDQGVLAVNTGGFVRMCNTEAERILGRRKEQLIGSAVHRVIPLQTEDGAHKKEERPFDIVMSTMRPYHSNPRITYRCPRADASSIPVAFSASPFVVEGVLKGVLILLRDVSEEKEIDMLKLESIALTSHQLRTPMTAISWYVEMIQNDLKSIPPEMREYFEQIAQSSKRMVKLVNSLLNMYRIERGDISIDPSHIDLAAFTRQTCEELAPQLDEKKIQLALQLPEKINATVDTQLLQIVLENLLTNAIKYSPDGSKITLKLSHSAHECQFEIADNGFGIPKKEQQHIFEKFFRAENVASQRGVGIGLFTVHAIVKAWEGHIWFQSGDHRGTTFFFTMPLAMRKVNKGQILWK